MSDGPPNYPALVCLTELANTGKNAETIDDN